MSDFECEIKVSDEYNLGDPVFVDFVLKNLSNDARAVLIWDFPAYGMFEKGLTVVGINKNKEVDYEGRKVFYGKPKKILILL